MHRRCKGGYAVVSVVLGLGLVAFRDPHGIRPLVLGKREHAEGAEYIVSSESAALDILGYQRVRDVRPGEALVITARGELFSEICASPTNNAPCIFEYVYFARPDSMIDNISVHKARMRMGLKLGERSCACARIMISTPSFRSRTPRAMWRWRCPTCSA